MTLRDKASAAADQAALTSQEAEKAERSLRAEVKVRRAPIPSTYRCTIVPYHAAKHTPFDEFPKRFFPSTRGAHNKDAVVGRGSSQQACYRIVWVFALSSLSGRSISLEIRWKGVLSCVLYSDIVAGIWYTWYCCSRYIVWTGRPGGVSGYPRTWYRSVS